MAPEVLARAFEPFFTTKGPGRGSGLGLSMIFGFAKQSGGHVSLYSEQGIGTTARIYLPLAVPAEAEPAREQGEAELRGHGETVLAVEDQPEVRRIVVRQLTHLGYRVLEAGSAEEALEILWTEQRVDLLFTDIVMAGMSGAELAEMARRARPDLKVLLTSGFADRFSGGAQLGHSEAVLIKPYRRPDLARRLRKLLDDGTLP
jgi:CheY-like chemotaxis protein